METRDVFAAVAMHALLEKLKLSNLDGETMLHAFGAVSDAAFIMADEMEKRTTVNRVDRQAAEAAKRLAETFRRSDGG